MRTRWVAWLAGAVGLLLLAPPVWAGGSQLASYRAVYDLVTDDTGDANGTASVDGRLVVEFTATHCGTYKSQMRFVTQGEDGDGNRQVTDSRADSVETTGGRFEFTNETYVNDELAEESAGVAQRTAHGVSVELTKPAKKTIVFDRDVAFPTEQLKKILAAAAKGQHFLAMDIFDGSQTGDIVFATATVLGKVSTAADDFGDEDLVGDAGFAGLPHWPLTISYFEKSKGTDDAPSYTTSFVGYTNGIGRKLKIDYGKFALVGHITHLTMLPAPPC